MKYQNLLAYLNHVNKNYSSFCLTGSGNTSLDIPYGGFKNYLAATNKPTIRSLNELKNQIDQNKWLFGHFAYDLKNELEPEKLISNNFERIKCDNLSFFEPDLLVQFDPDSGKPEFLKGSVSDWNENDPFETSEMQMHNFIFKSMVEFEDYKRNFKHLREHLEKGDIYEINYCQEFYIDYLEGLDPVELFIILLNEYPMPFSALYKFDGKYLISASPERFIKKTGHKIVSQPMKGTNRASDDIELNKQYQQNLKNSEKERSENMMIMDLVRNDLAKSSIPGSVKVEELFGVYKMNSVNQMITTIGSLKRDDVHILDTILNAFPMGSMTGAPKISAMELIEKYETSKRGIYSGSLGYFDPNGDYDFNVIIRSLVYDQLNKVCSIFAGGAITYDSDCRSEYDECILKAEFMFKLLNNELQD